MAELEAVWLPWKAGAERPSLAMPRNASTLRRFSGIDVLMNLIRSYC
jgi:antirestriction protein ArdC